MLSWYERVAHQMGPATGNVHRSTAGQSVETEGRGPSLVCYHLAGLEFLGRAVFQSFAALLQGGFALIVCVPLLRLLAAGSVSCQKP